MATKLTLAFGPDFHLYHDAEDDAHVYLELQAVGVVPIPVQVWEVIRRYPVADLSLAEMSDGQLRREVERQVAARLEAHEAGGFGPTDAPREAQIAKGLAVMTARREQQRWIRQAIAELERLNRRMA